MNDINGESLGLLDILTIVGFVINLQNYGKNVDQTKLQETMNAAVSDIHEHLKEQDRNIEHILEMLKGEKTNG